MAMVLHQASRKKANLRIGLAGPSGSGKTYSALLLAYGLCGDWSKIALIDTENGSGDLYSNLGEYQVLTLQEPFDPRRYIEAIKTCENAGAEVIIIDSITHEWNGPGGCLEMHDKATKAMRNPNSYMAWNQITPLHDQFIQSIIQSRCHIITTVRSKTEYILVDYNGRQRPQKAGMGQVTRDGFEYELTVSFDLNQDHTVIVSKDRTEMFSEYNGESISIKTGEMLLEWANSGADDKIDKDTVYKIEAEIERTDTKLGDILEHYNVTSLKQLNTQQAQNCLALLNKKTTMNKIEQLPNGEIAH